MSSASIVDPVPQSDASIPEFPQNEPNPTPAVAEPELPKPWNIEDPFQYAPPKPEGDHWDLLLEPFVKEEQMRCDGWRDEVQNLLIFAGLFSGVVTAFIMESYKNLQQNPNDVMIGLLTHIALRLDNPSNNASTVPLPVQKPFSPSPSTVRVNNFWFISLVLSLTTVLVGIVSLQWLREHQYYPTLSSRERYAVTVMRSKAFSRWYVDKVFIAMPLLLQCALILFLGGLVDFIHNLGDRNVLIPVAIAIAFTLFFIVATTLLPSLQILSFYFHIPHFGQAKGQFVDPPHPCPYKSPQSHAFRKLLRPLTILFDRSYPPIRSIAHAIAHIKIPFSSMSIPALEVDDFTRYLGTASTTEDWISFDLAWLAIRDGYLRRACGRSSVDELVGRSWKVNQLLGGRDSELIPITDILSGISLQGYNKNTSAPAYYAFCEISELTLLPLKRPDDYYQTPEDLFRQSAYLHDLLSGGVAVDEEPEATLTDIFDLDDLLFKPLPGENPADNQTTLDNTPAMLIHHENTSYYLRYHFASDAPMLSTHRTELGVRLIRYFCLEHPETRDKIKNDKLRYPGCLYFTRFDSWLGPDFKTEVDFNVVGWQVSNVILLVLQQLHEHEHRPNTFLNNFFSQSTLTSFMDTATFFTARSLHNAPPPNISEKLDTAVQNTFYAIFSLLRDHLSQEIFSWTKAEGQPSLIFYLAALYTQPLMEPLEQNMIFSSLYLIIQKYKRRTIDMGIADLAIEKRLKADPNVKFYHISPELLFSAQWWQEFDPPTPVSDSTSYGRNSPSIVMYYPFSTSENNLVQE